MGYPVDKGIARSVLDSKGNSHYMLFQELSMSCGPACIAMAESLYKLSCIVNPEKRAREISQLFPGGFSASGGTFVSNLSSVLNGLGVKTHHSVDIPDKKIYRYLSHYVTDQTPTIAHIKWYSRKKFGSTKLIQKGGHFTLVKKVYDDGTIVFLDPWYGVVETKKNDLPAYNPIGAAGKLSGWMIITYQKVSLKIL